MKFLSSFAVLGLVLLQACGAKQTPTSDTKNVFGSDDREDITTSEYPWRTIGKVFGMGCTGTLISKNLVLTAAHCVIDTDTHEMRSDITYFKPNYKNGSYADESWITHVWWGTNNPDSNRGLDWAILQLSDSLGDRYGWLGIRNTTAETFPPALTVAGYSEDYHNGETAGVHHNCNTRRRFDSANMIFHDCDTARGSSGGPALRMYDDKLTIVGVNVAEKRNGGDQSLNLSSYDDDHANIVIPTSGLLAKVNELLQEH